MADGWQREEIDGRPAERFDPHPAGAAGAGVVLFLHDFDARPLSESPVFTAELKRLGLRAVCPIADRCWWTTVACPDFDPVTSPLAYVRDAVVPFIGRTWNVAPPAIGLLGIGMGGQGELQLAYRAVRQNSLAWRRSRRPSTFTAWYGYGLSLDQMFASKEAARQQTATLHLHPLNWPKHQFLCCDPADEYWFDGTDRLAMKFSSMGIPYGAT